MSPRVGIDFDNTLVCYRGVFHRAAREKGLIPEDLPPHKSSVRNYLRDQGREDEWTRLQGYVYGKRIDLADPFEGVKDSLGQLIQQNVPIEIISHKTSEPYLGPPYDLHEAARKWLHDQSLLGPDGIGIPAGNVHFEPTKQAKLERIHLTGCDVFVDDLPEFLEDPEFPAYVEKILFDPNGQYEDRPEWSRLKSWDRIREHLL